jgi:protein involved in polysaccharide export with SLBB domain
MLLAWLWRLPRLQPLAQTMALPRRFMRYLLACRPDDSSGHARLFSECVGFLFFSAPRLILQLLQSSSMNMLPSLRGNAFPPFTNMKVCRALFFAGVAALVGACPVVAHAADNTTAKPADDKTNGQNDSEKIMPGSSFQENNYVLRPTDVIGVRVVDDDRASGSFTIGVDGTVALTYLDPDHPLKLEGLTVAEAVKLISKAYIDQKIFIKPTITLTVQTYAERRVYVMGLVTSPGWVVIPPEQKLSLVAAIAQAHGPTQNAAGTVTITRKMPDGSTKTFKNVDLLGATKGTSPDFPLQEGDTITLGESLLGNVWQ